MFSLLGLLGWVCFRGFQNDWPSGIVLLGAQVIIAAGALFNLFHFAVLKRGAGNLGTPSMLVTQGGLLPWVRHPMYLGESVLVLGFAILGTSMISSMFALMYIVSITRLCLAEDRSCSAQFPESFASWAHRSKRLIPAIW
ncbi:MAG: DUF1295 domain-containing protein [Verrucomicrobiota bacterium]